MLSLLSSTITGVSPTSSTPTPYLEPPSSSPAQLRRTSTRTSVRSKKPHRSLLSPILELAQASQRTVTDTVLHARDGLTAKQRAEARWKAERLQIVRAKLQIAADMQDWLKAATELDELEDNDVWKQEQPGDDAVFDTVLIKSRLKMLQDAQLECDVRQMLYLIRTSLSRNLGGTGERELYRHSHAGTKYLIEEYISATISTIRKLVEISTDEARLPKGMEAKDLLEQVVCARQAFGRSALLLSGGATLGMYHIGVLKALFEAKLLPRIISGASAGSIVGSVLCTRTDEEIPDMLDTFPYGDLAVFEDAEKGEGPLEHMTRLLTQGAWIDIKHLTRVMRELLGEMTFQEAYNRTRRILNICVSPSSVYELPTLLNYITAPNVLIWSAVAASCSIPLVFSSAELVVKNPLTGLNEAWNPTPLRWIDGSVDNDLPMTRLAEMFNVNHFIVSQVNPHVTPFLSTTSPSLTAAPSLFTLNSKISSVVAPITEFAKSEALHRLQILSQLRIFPNLCNKTRNMLSQKYSGDITILPKVEMLDLGKLLKNPTAEFMLKACREGERATWPLLGRVKCAVEVELELDKAVGELRGRVVFGNGKFGVYGSKGGQGHQRGTAQGLGRGRSHDGNGRQRAISGAGYGRLVPSTGLAGSSHSGPTQVAIMPQTEKIMSRPWLRTSKSYEHRVPWPMMSRPGSSQGLGIDLGDSWEDIAKDERELLVEPMTKISTAPGAMRERTEEI